VKTRTCVLAAALLLRAGAARAGDEALDWWLTQRGITDTLMRSGTNLAALVEQVNRRAPASGQEALFRLCVLTRAGARKQAIEALRDVKRLCPKLDNYQVSSIYHDACDHLGTWDLAQAVVELFADNVSEIALDNRLLKHFADSGWSTDRVDQWLASRPAGVDNFWVKARLRFNTARGRGEALEQELAARVRANPKDVGGAVAFLDALAYARAGVPEKPDLAWMAEAVKPEWASAANDIASRLARFENWKTAAEFYRRALALPLTGEEVVRLAMMCQALLPEATVRAAFAAQTREGLAECLLKTEQPEEAQKWMVEAADIREKNNLGRNALFAGQVQQASGQRVMEERLGEEEQPRADDPKYWCERAQYYRGRKEAALEEDALTNGLARAAPQPEPARAFKGHRDWRSRLLADYAHFLAREKREVEAVALLRQELASAPADADSSKRAACLLGFDFPEHLDADDAVLWAWLEKRPKWESAEERLLLRMLEKAERDDLDGRLARAEQLAFGNDPSRAHALGWIENRMAFPKRSIPLLLYAAEKAGDKELKERAAFTLLESYLDTADWRGAEAIFPEAAQRLTPRELPEWYSRIAVLAARAGAEEDAMRIWRRVAGLDLTATGALADLVRAGLRDELVSFYREKRKQIPSSEVPDKVLRNILAPANVSGSERRDGS